MFFYCIFCSFLLLSTSSPVLNYRSALKLITSQSDSDLQSLAMISSERISSPEGDNTLLHVAAIYGRVEALKVLLSALGDEYGSIIDSPSKKNSSSSSSPSLAMFRSRSSSRAKSLSLSPSPLLDSYDGSGLTPLIGAIAMGHTQIVSLLLQAGASPNLPDRKSSTKAGLKRLSPLQWSLKYRRTDIVKLLIATGTIDFSYSTPRKGRNFWHYAARYIKDRDLLQSLPTAGLEQPDLQGNTPLQLAQLHKNTTFISLFQCSNSSEENRLSCTIS